ncbi:MAG: hypothetical protein KBE65_00520 [Phycisphaerae bacterium]|nr:hypothetical protein [Phycisphaerae bacterium]
MFHARRIVTATVLFWLLESGVLCLPAAGRDVKLVLHPQKASTEVGKLSLLSLDSAMIDGDAVPLYEKAVKALPDKAGDKQIQEWLNMPIAQLPVDEVEQALMQYTESLKSVTQAVKCRQCNWPAWKPGTQVPETEGYRRLAFAIRLWARLEIAQDGYDGAILALQTGAGMARQHAQAPTLLQVQVGIAMAAITCRELEEFIQRQDAPNLYLALENLPKPFADVERAIQIETKAAASRMFSEQYESVLKPAHDRTRVLAKRLDRDLAILRCVEAIRSYAATHNGQLPKALAEIAEVSVPADPLHDGSFQYALRGSTAVLESAPPVGGSDREAIRYEISVKN